MFIYGFELDIPYLLEKFKKNRIPCYTIEEIKNYIQEEYEFIRCYNYYDYVAIGMNLDMEFRSQTVFYSFSDYNNHMSDIKKIRNQNHNRYIFLADAEIKKFINNLKLPHMNLKYLIVPG